MYEFWLLTTVVFFALLIFRNDGMENSPLPSTSNDITSQNNNDCSLSLIDSVNSFCDKKRNTRVRMCTNEDCDDCNVMRWIYEGCDQKYAFYDKKIRNQSSDTQKHGCLGRPNLLEKKKTPNSKPKCSTA